MTHRHPSEVDLALFAGGDCGFWQRFRLNSHVSRCGDCKDTLASFGELRSVVREVELPQVVSNEADWNRIAGEMRANIRLGIAAGECIGDAPDPTPHTNWMPRFAMAAAGVILLAGAGIFLRGLLPQGDLPSIVHAAVVESTGKGVQLRTDSGSMMLLNHGDVAGDQTVTSQGAARASYIDGNTGTVTVTSVYVE
jgi:hypothetical protein